MYWTAILNAPRPEEDTKLIGNTSRAAHSKLRERMLVDVRCAVGLDELPVVTLPSRTNERRGWHVWYLVADPEGVRGSIEPRPRSQISHENERIWSHNNLRVSVRPNYFIFMRYLRYEIKSAKRTLEGEPQHMNPRFPEPDWRRRIMSARCRRDLRDERKVQYLQIRKVFVNRGMEYTILINWTSSFYSNLDGAFCKQTVNALIRRCGFWVCTCLPICMSH